MNEESPAWFKTEEESSISYTAFASFRDMGNSRSIDGAYLKLREKCGAFSGKKAPNSWWRWAVENDWKTRCHAYDLMKEAEVEEIEKRRRREILENSYDEIVQVVEKTARLAKNTLDSADLAVGLGIESDVAPAATARIRTAFTGAQVAVALIMESSGIGEYIERKEQEKARGTAEQEDDEESEECDGE
jgi:hypothetical protein